MAAKRASEKAKTTRVFGQAQKPAKMFRAGIYARVSTDDQQTIPLQIRALREYAARRGWTIALQVKEVGSGASERQQREKLLEAARRAAKSTWSWCGAWIGGGARSRTCWRPCKNWSISGSVSFP
jgi:hypothetical protein